MAVCICMYTCGVCCVCICMCVGCICVVCGVYMCCVWGVCVVMLQGSSDKCDEVMY